VATPEAWMANPVLVQGFYNMRRKAVMEAKPNAAHQALAEYQSHFDIIIITQNIDDLHERAGSKNVLHLHGEITKSQSTRNPNLVYDIDGYELKMGDTCELGAQLRPFIVWFGEAVPKMEDAIELVQEADIVMVVGTSLQVYPAAGLVNYAPATSPIYIIDPGAPAYSHRNNLTFIQQKASVGVPQLLENLKNNLP
jgi:NAD-dependent deacetylase